MATIPGNFSHEGRESSFGKAGVGGDFDFIRTSFKWGFSPW
jgi:hypothetical protein